MTARPRTHHTTCTRCDWEGWYTTPGYATKAHNKHTCGPHTPVECGRHTHGQAAHYKHCACRCWPCRLAMLDQHDASDRARAYGRTRHVDATPARQRLQALTDAGMGSHSIANAAGLHRDTIDRILRRKWRNGHWETARRITRATEQAILAVTYNPADGAPAIDAAPTRRRLQALVALGWYPCLLARHIGYDQSYLDRILHGRQTRIRPGTARRIHTHYQRLADAPSPTGTYADRARAQAKTRGWAPPLRIAGHLHSGPAIDTPGRDAA